MDLGEYIFYKVTSSYTPEENSNQDVLIIDRGDQLKVNGKDIPLNIDAQFPGKIWLYGHNMRTSMTGFFPSKYVNYESKKAIELPSIPLPDDEEDDDETDACALPQPGFLKNKLQSFEKDLVKPSKTAKGIDFTDHAVSHCMTDLETTKPMMCIACNDYIWGSTNNGTVCEGCGVTCHLNCNESLEDMEAYVHCTKSSSTTLNKENMAVEDWDISNVFEWMACCNLLEYCEVFKLHGINGNTLKHLDEDKLIKIKITDTFHRQAILLARDELFDLESDAQSYKFDLPSPIEDKDSDKRFRSQHNLVIRNFSTVQRCYLCKNFLNGIFRQGYSCTSCEMVCHKLCMSEDFPECSSKKTVKLPHDPSKMANIIVDKCIHELEKRWNDHTTNSSVEIYMKSLPTEEIEPIRSTLLFSNTESSIDLSIFESLEITSFLKKYLRELPYTVIPESTYTKFIECSTIEDQDDGLCLRRLKECRNLLPERNKLLLDLILSHLTQLCLLEKKISQPVDELAKVFSSILMRPLWENIADFVHNTEHHLRIITVLLNDKLNETPPKIPPPRRPSVLPEYPDAPLSNFEWYWGDIAREIVNDKMRDMPDGSFLLRNTTNKSADEYTLTVRKGGSNKLIKIYHVNDGKCGFSKNSMNFDSVVSLINYYRINSLIQYNSALDVKLIKPVEKGKDDDCKNNSNENIDFVKGIFTEYHYEYQVQAHKLDTKMKNHNDFNEKIREKNQALNAYQKIIELFETHKGTASKTIANSSSKDKLSLSENYGLMENALLQYIENKKELEHDLKSFNDQNRIVVAEMNSLKPDLKRLQRNLDNVRNKLLNHGVTNADIEQLIGFLVDWWYMPDCNGEQAIELLSERADGTFLIRNSSMIEKYALCVVANGEVKQCIIDYNNDIGMYGFGKNYIHKSLPALVAYYKDKTLVEHNVKLNVSLKFPVRDGGGPEDTYA